MARTDLVRECEMWGGIIVIVFLDLIKGITQLSISTAIFFVLTSTDRSFFFLTLLKTL